VVVSFFPIELGRTDGIRCEDRVIGLFPDVDMLAFAEVGIAVVEVAFLPTEPGLTEVMDCEDHVSGPSPDTDMFACVEVEDL
jgi:hypothetical protein